ncbi:hypothetical protein Taro_026459, partial [Colocasia esculenta]|nr:hypothetical protein [Colocasia esculenta]
SLIPTPEDETRPTKSFVGLEADGVNITDVPRRWNQADGVMKLMASTQPASPEDETRPTKSFVGLEANGVNIIGVPKR